VINILKSANLINDSVKPVIDTFKSLPDNSESFFEMFVDMNTGNVTNVNLLKRRILGLTSYFRSEQEELLPSFVKTPDGNNYHIIKSPMSNHQFEIYSKIRQQEAEKEKNAAKQRRMNPDELFKVVSSYRIFSRAACNFVFPDGIVRPIPDKIQKDIEGEEGEEESGELNEADFDAVPKSIRKNMEFSPEQGDDEDEGEEQGETNVNSDDLTPQETTYLQRIENAMEQVNVSIDGTSKSKFLDESVLDIVSPKFKSILENLKDPTNQGLHLLYSNFRTIEGIGILRLILLANGFAEFKIHKSESSWEIVETDTDLSKPRFVLYTGTETNEDKEMIRNIYNGEWKMVPVNITNKLKEIAENNKMGEIIKLFMITSSGAEGITLKNTRFVHITEPYWHMVRVEQVVGRARRICSHQDLPEEMRNVKVFLYITELSKEQKTDEKNIELRVRDISHIDKKTPITTDESLYEKAVLKQRINNEFLRAIKESAVDCTLYKSTSKVKQTDITDSEPRVCYGFGKVESNAFSSYPSLEEDKQIKEGLDDKEKALNLQKITFKNVVYGVDNISKDVYDFKSYEMAKEDPNFQLILVGKLVIINGKKQIEFL
jgi:hypothetical protein